MENLGSQIIQGFGFGYDKTGFVFAQNQQCVTGLDAEELPGFLGNDDLSPIAHLGGAKNTVLVTFAEDVLASSHGNLLLKSYFSYFSYGRIIQKSTTVVNTAVEKFCRKFIRIAVGN